MKHECPRHAMLSLTSIAVFSIAPIAFTQTLVHDTFQKIPLDIDLPVNQDTSLNRKPYDVELHGLRGDPVNPTGVEQEPDLAVVNFAGASVYVFHHTTGFSYDPTLGASQFQTGTLGISIAAGDRLILNNSRPNQQGVDIAETLHATSGLRF